MSGRFMIVVRGPLSDLHLKKDPVCIPTAFSKLGFDSIIVTTKSYVKLNNIKILELGETFPNIYCCESMKRRICKDFIQVVEALILGVRLFMAIRKVKPNIVITYSDPLLFPWLFFSRSFLRFKLICKLDWDGIIRYKGVKRACKIMALLMASIFCDAQIIESSEAFNRVISFAPFAKRNLRVIPNGISEEFLQKATNCPYYEREKVILTVAGVQRYKFLEYLIQAFSILKDRYADYKLRIVGPIIDKKYFQELNELIERLQLKVIFTGKISDEDLIKEYLTARVFCLPSSVEGFSIARLEAMTLGLPVVTTKTGGSEIVKGAGFIVNIGDINGLAKALDALLKDDALWCEMSNKAKTIAKQMTWENLVRKILRLLT